MDTEPQTLTVQWVLPDGRGGGPCDQGSFRARGVLPGDRIRPLRTRRRGRTLDVTAHELIAAGPRADHPCPVIDACGGCDLGRMPAVTRREQLRAIVARALQLDALPPLLAPAAEASHRARIKLHLEGDRLGYRAARSDALVPIGDCHAACPAIRAAIPALVALLPLRGAASVELRSDGRRVVFVFDALDRAEHARVAALGDVAIGRRRLHGDPTLSLDVAGLSLRASPLSFFQVNPAGNELLVQWVMDHARAAAPERILDLYAGIGNLTLPLATLGAPVTAVEVEGQATADLRHSAAALGLPIEVRTGDVGRFDLTTTPADLVVLDPPRAGAPGVVERMMVLRPRTILMISCHVPSAARDLRPALQAGYAIVDVAAVDLFPHTHHVEALIALQRPR